MQATMEVQALLAQQVTLGLMAHQEPTVMQARQQPSATMPTSQAERLVLVEQEVMEVQAAQQEEQAEAEPPVIPATQETRGRTV